MENKITSKDIEKILSYKPSDKLKNKIDSYELKYSNISENEKNDYLIRVVDTLTSDITQSGKHRILEWENGWKENFLEFKKTKSFNSLVPKYHDKNRFARWKQEIIKPQTVGFDYKIHVSFIDCIVEKYTKNLKRLYEFGCGPAYHLVRFSEIFSHLKLYGMDWTRNSQEIIKEISLQLDLDIEGHNFDFFNPNYEFDIREDSAILTVAALEQTGENYEKFVEYLLEKKPKVCINFEPMSEFLDNKNLIDFLSIKYFEKRKYLKNYLNFLESLEKQGKIKILEKRRIYSGSFFIEGHSLVVWEPI